MKKLLSILLCMVIITTAMILPDKADVTAAESNNGLLANWYQINSLDAPGLNNKIDGNDRYSPEGLFESSYFQMVQSGVSDSNGLYITSSDLDQLAGQMGIIQAGGDYKSFGIKYTGYLTPTATGTYAFRGLCDNAFFVMINGKAVLDFWSSKWKDVPGDPYIGTSIYLESGKEYRVEVYYIEVEGGNTFQLEWNYNGGSYGRIPQNLFTKTSNSEVTITRDFSVSQKQAAGDADFILWQSDNIYADIVSVVFRSESGTTITVPADGCTSSSLLISGFATGYKPTFTQGKWTVSLTLKNVNTIARFDSNNVRFGLKFNAAGLVDHASANFDVGNCIEIYAGENISYDQTTGAVQFGVNTLTVKELREGSKSSIFQPKGVSVNGSQSAQTGLMSNWYKINNLTSSALGTKLKERRMSAQDLFNTSDFQAMAIGRVDTNGLYIDSNTFNATAAAVGIPSNNGDYQYFGVKYYGYIVPTTTGNYKFKMLCDNAFTLRIGGVEAISFWDSGWRDDPANPVMGNTLYLEAGKQYYVEAFFVEDYGGNLVQVEWSNNGGVSFSRIPQNLFKQTNDAPITISRDFYVSSKQSQGVADFNLWQSENTSAEVISVTFTPEHGNPIVISGAQCNKPVGGNLIQGFVTASRPQLAQGNWKVTLSLNNTNTLARPDSNNIRFGLKFYASGLVGHANANFDVGNCEEIYPGETAVYNESTGAVGFANNSLTIKELREGTNDNITWYDGQTLPAFSTISNNVHSIDVTKKSSDIKTAMTSLQGIINRKQPRLLVLNDAGEGNLTWPRTLGISHTYKANYLDMIYEFKNEIKGLVVYDNNLEDTINVACSIAGVEDTIAVSPAMADILVKAPYNLSVLVDLRGMFTTKHQAYDHLYNNYWPRMTKRLIVGMHPTGHNAHMRDMAIATRAAILWLEPNNSADKACLDKFYSGSIVGSTYHAGWWPEEGSGVGYGTQKGVPTLPSDFFENATIYAAQSKNIYTPTVPAKPNLENKIYVMLSLSDGDNLQYNQHVMKMKWDSEPRGQVPIGWTCSPALLDAAPGILDHYYKTATDNDVLISGPSGIGYSRLQMFTSDYNVNKYFQATNKYFEKTSFNIITIWNEFKTFGTSRYSNAVANYFPSLLGLTTQEKSILESRIRTVNGRIPLIIFADNNGLMSYDQDTNNIKNKLSNIAAGFNGSSPQFYAGQLVAWNVRVGAINTMVNELNAQYPGKFAFVRPDHFMMLYNESNGNPYNVSLRAATTASAYDSGYDASKSVDGSIAPEKGWKSSSSGNKWLQVDLGKNKTISRYVVKNAGTAYMSNIYNTKDFKLQVSTNGTTWTDVDTVSGNTENIVYRNITSTTARYVRLYITNAGADNVARIQDFEVYGK